MISLVQLLPLSFRNRYRNKWQQFNLITKSFFIKIARFFFRPPFPQLENGEVYVHLGCGTINHPKFINVDGIAYDHVHYIRQLDNLNFLRDDSVDLIYACHCLEHFSHRKIDKILKEWCRVLKKDGILRLSVPDFDLLICIYKENGSNIEFIQKPLMGGQDSKLNFHYSLFNKKNLEKILLECGFRKVQEWNPGSCELTSMDDTSSLKFSIGGREYPVSLNIEAIK